MGGWQTILAVLSDARKLSRGKSRGKHVVENHVVENH